jgi:hypothetical protein
MTYCFSKSETLLSSRRLFDGFPIPIAPTMMNTLLPTCIDDLLRLSKAELDDLFKRLEPGPLPEGNSQGAAIVWPGTRGAGVLCWFARRFAWQGKVFTKFPGGNGATLVNKITPFGIHAIVARVYFDGSWMDAKPCIHIDYSKTSLLARKVRDEIRQIAPGFYLGKVWWGKKRLIDFALKF